MKPETRKTIIGFLLSGVVFALGIAAMIGILLAYNKWGGQ